MNTKNIVAILMATIIAMALFAPTAMAQDPPVTEPTEATVGNLPPYVCCQWETPNLASPFSPVVTIHACVCDPNGADDINVVYACTPKGTIVPMPSSWSCEPRDSVVILSYDSIACA